jgi:SSS family solute:Na+ symporter
MSKATMFTSPRRAIARAALGSQIHFGIWVSCITVAVFAALGDLRPAIFNEVLR